MRYWLLLALLVVLIIAGCKTTQDSIDAYKLCMANDTCRAQMQANGIIAANAVKEVKVNGLSGILEAVAFNLASGLTGIILGRKLKRC